MNDTSSTKNLKSANWPIFFAQNNGNLYSALEKMDKTTVEFQEKLEAAHKFPTIYMFKFIVLEEKKELVEALFAGNDVISKPSSKGKYISITAKPMMGSSEAIIEIYKKAHKIEGIIAL